MFTTALNDFVTVIHPCRGVKTPTVAVKELRIVTPEEYVRLRRALPPDTAALLVEIAISSGLRWGELTELLPRDVAPTSGILTVSRAVNEVDPKFHPDGGRFYVKAYPKSKRPRRMKLEPALIATITTHALGPDDLLLQDGQFQAPAATVRLIDVNALGVTVSNAEGRQYRHGMLRAYTAGRCRCDHCKSSFARYRGVRRAGRLDSPRTSRTRDSDGHISRD